MLSLPPQIFIPRFPPVFSSALRVLSCTRLRFNWTDPPRILQSQPCFAMHPTETILAKLVVADVFSYRLGGTREKTDPTFLTFAQIYLTVLASFSVPSFARAKRSLERRRNILRGTTYGVILRSRREKDFSFRFLLLVIRARKGG